MEITKLSKQCSKCGQDKPESEYYKSRDYSDGLKKWCKSCMVANRREWTKKNPEKNKEFRKQDYVKHSENYKRKAKEWREQNPERKIALDRQWRAENLQRKADNDKKWRASPDGKAKRYNNENRRREKEKSGRGISLEEKSVLLSDPCVYCGSRAKMTLDHIVPLNKGGSHSSENLAPACVSCNSSKHTKSLLAFLYERR